MTIATVLSITGQAWARDADGQLRELSVGDSLQEGETLVTSDSGRVVLDFGDNLEPTTIGEGREVVMTPELASDAPVEAADASAQDADLEALLTAIDEGQGDLLEDLDATAAGAGAGGGSEGGHSFVRLARISESVDPLAFAFGANSLEGADEIQLEGGALATEEPDDVPIVDTADLDGDGDEVWESALPEGSGGGSLTTGGSLQIDTGGDTLALIEVQDAGGTWIAISADATAVQGAYGTLTVNPDGSWSYTLDANTLDHDGAGLTGDADQVQDLFGVRVTDDDGDVSAPATLAIDVNDDGPVAADDGVDGEVAEEGSVEIDVFANDSAGADSVDLATGIAVASGPSQGSVVYNGDGTFTYTAAPGAEGADSFTYTLTDREGDTTTATVTLSVAADSTPTVATADLNEDGDEVWESALPEGSGGGSLTTGGSLQIDTGGDTLDLIEVQDAGGTWIAIESAGTLVQGAYGTLSMDPDGSWSYTLDANTLDHDDPSATGAGDQVQDPFTVRVTDDDGDVSAPATLAIDVNDDGPSITASVSDGDGVTLNTQDAELTDTATASFAAAFTVAGSSHGADGAGATSWNYALDLAVAEGSDSGLTSGGDPVHLYQVGGEVVGATAASAGAVADANTVFTLAVDGGGNVTLTQRAAVDHATADTSDYASDQQGLGTGLVNLVGTVTITDSEGDSASDSETLDLGGNVLFDDAGPSITASVSDGDGVTLNTQDAELTDTATASFTAAFTVAGSSHGADGAGATSWNYALDLAVAEGSDSGLTSGGDPVHLYQVGGEVVGATAASAGAVADANTVFTLAVDGDGNVTLTQRAAVDHATADTSDYASDQQGLGTGLVNLVGTVTITDSEGDSASDSETLDLGGNVLFDDAGPSITASVSDGDGVTLNTQDAELTDTATASFAAAFTVAGSSHGADGAGTTSWNYALDLAVAEGSDSGLTSGGDPVHLYQVGGEVVGATAASAGAVADANTVFTLAVDGDGNVTLTQRAAVDHATADTSDYASDQQGLGTGLVNLVGTVTITDSEGDSASDSETLDLGGNVLFDDDGPSVVPTPDYVAPALTLDESPLSVDGLASASSDFSGAFATTIDYGTDGAGGVTYGLSLAGDALGSGLYALGADGTAGGEIQLARDGDDIIGQLDGTEYFRISVNDSGTVTFTQSANIWHGEGEAAHDDPESLEAASGTLLLTQTVTDADGDSASAAVDLSAGVFTIEDDGPRPFLPQAAHVLLAVDAAEATQQTVTQPLNFLPGTDGLGDIVFNLSLVDGKQAFLSVDGDQLYLDNEPLFLRYTDGSHHSIQAVTENGDIGFEATIDAEGNVTYTIFSGSIMTDSKITSVTDLSGIGGGNVAFKGLNIGTKQAMDPDGTDDVLVSSEILPVGDTDQGSVNSTSTTLGVGQGAEISDGEVVRYDLVSSLSVDDTQNAESYSFDGYQQTSAFTQDIVVSGGKEASFYLRIYSMGLDEAATGASQSLVSGTGGDGQLTLTAGEVKIFDENGIEQTGHVTSGVDGSVLVEGLQDGWSFQIVSVDTSLDPEAFNAVEIEGVELNGGDTTSFKLGGFSYGEEPSFSPVSFELPVLGSDADGDSLDGQVAITVYPDSESIVGDSQDNTLSGTGEDDTLFGLEGADTLVGGQGDDVLAGGLGADTFAWQFGDSGDQGVPGGPATDLVTDFNLNEADEGDALLLSDLLQGTDAESDFANYLHAVDDGQGNTLLHVSTSGAFEEAFNSAESDQVIALNGVSMEGADSSAFIQSLIDSGQLDIE
ncbi:retention module-containing protein [Halomonas nitroreducens]|uniref:Retention module-containing protein n=1 Tax=Halomonas nitroreducens TaxID=447425 RepID=A0A3S0JCH9_9GAMM|nr:retention module-containing protein [Halomonas nitroreducens]RTR06412.1 retention module-containing protein [Halomonas nitroreducens]